jgi:hypothetical protein
MAFFERLWIYRGPAEPNICRSSSVNLDGFIYNLIQSLLSGAGAKLWRPRCKYPSGGLRLITSGEC